MSVPFSRTEWATSKGLLSCINIGALDKKDGIPIVASAGDLDRALSTALDAAAHHRRHPSPTPSEESIPEGVPVTVRRNALMDPEPGWRSPGTKHFHTVALVDAPVHPMDSDAPPFISHPLQRLGALAAATHSSDAHCRRQFLSSPRQYRRGVGYFHADVACDELDAVSGFRVDLDRQDRHARHDMPGGHQIPKTDGSPTAHHMPGGHQIPKTDGSPTAHHDSYTHYSLLGKGATDGSSCRDSCGSDCSALDGVSRTSGSPSCGSYVSDSHPVDVATHRTARRPLRTVHSASEAGRGGRGGLKGTSYLASASARRKAAADKHLMGHYVTAAGRC